MQAERPSREHLLSQIKTLQEQLEEVKNENADLEILLETITEHSTDLENQIYEKNQQMLKYLEQVEKVTAAAAAVENDRFKPESLNEVAARSDELGQLARVFQQMVQTVKAREQELAQAKDQLEAVLDAVPGAISWMDAEGIYLGVNRRLAESLNLPPEAFFGKELGFFNKKSQFAQFMYQFLASQQTAASQEIETGSPDFVRYFLIAAQKYQQGNAAVTVGIDITERKQAEEALRIAEENYRSIFENALEGIFQVTPEGQFIRVNPAMAHTYGYDSPQEMMATVPEIGSQLYVDPSCREKFQCLMEEQGEVKNFEYQVYQKDGSKLWVAENTRAVRDTSGKLLYYEGIIQDVTKRKQREEALQRQVEELQIEIDKTKQAQKVAEIVESDSFKDLKQKLNRMKKRRATRSREHRE